MTGEAENTNADERLEVREVVLVWKGKDYRISASDVVEAFDRAGYGDFAGPHGRFYMAVDGELKSVERVFAELVPVGEEELTREVAGKVNEVFAALGFEVKDRHAHHE